MELFRLILTVDLFPGPRLQQPLSVAGCLWIDSVLNAVWCPLHLIPSLIPETSSFADWVSPEAQYFSLVTFVALVLPR